MGALLDTKTAMSTALHLCTIGPLARKFEFYRFLAMYQARASFQIRDDTYFAGTMVKITAPSNVRKALLHMPPNNLIVLSTMPAFRGHQRELAELYSQLRGMAIKKQTSHVYAIKGSGGCIFFIVYYSNEN